MDTGATPKELEHDVSAPGDGSEVNGGVTGVIGLLQELAAISFEKLPDSVGILLLNGVA